MIMPLAASLLRPRWLDVWDRFLTRWERRLDPRYDERLEFQASVQQRLEELTVLFRRILP